MSRTLISAVLPDLSKRFQANQEQMALAFLPEQFGSALGGLLGFSLDRSYRYIDAIIGALAILSAVQMVLKPVIPNLYVLGTFMFIEGTIWTLVGCGKLVTNFFDSEFGILQIS